MRCVILAAGTATRLQPLTDNVPKCLLSVGGIPLLQRTLENVLSNGINEIAVVTGFGADQLESFVRDRTPYERVTFIHNPDYQQSNNAYSLSLARRFVDGKPFLLLDSDILFGKELLTYLLGNTRKPNRLAVRVRGSHDEEEMRVKIDRWNRVVAIGKQIALEESYGESIGMEVFSGVAARRLFEILDDRMTQRVGRKEFYEASFQQLIDEGEHLWAIDTSSYPSAEIDTHEDLHEAETIIARQIDHA